MNTSDVLLVAAAGNSSLNNDAYPSYPANLNLPNVISVAATDRFDNKASFSNYGPTTVDLGAPGVDIVSTFTMNAAYATLSGTSMATPHVAALLALVGGGGSHGNRPADQECHLQRG